MKIAAHKVVNDTTIEIIGLETIFSEGISNSNSLNYIKEKNRLEKEEQRRKMGGLQQQIDSTLNCSMVKCRKYRHKNYNTNRTISLDR